MPRGLVPLLAVSVLVLLAVAAKLAVRRPTACTA
jgi:hypothetical protein